MTGGVTLAEGRNVAITTVLVALIGAGATVGAALVAARGGGGGGKNSPATPVVTVPSFTIPPFDVTPASVFLSRTSGAGGSKVNVSGTGFRPGERVTLRFHTDQIGDTNADSAGKFQNVEVTIPTSFSKFAPQQFNIGAQGASSLQSPMAPFTITG